MNFFSKISLIELGRLIEGTKSELFLCLPGIPQIISKSIINLKEKRSNILVNVLIDFDPQTFRQGYGEFDAFTELESRKIKITNYPDNRISFIIIDNIGYYLFIESQYLIPAEKETLNAIKLDNVSMVKLKQHFFSESTLQDYTNELSNAIIQESLELKELEKKNILPDPAQTKIITKKDIEIVTTEIEKKPPLKPDHKRIMDVYSNKFQYVDLKFLGVNIKNKEVTIPKSLLPIKNKELQKQFNTTIKIFNDNFDKLEFGELKKLNDELADIRKKHLFHSKVCNRSILELKDKNEFNGKVKKIEEKIPILKTNLLTFLYDQMKVTQDGFYDEIYKLVKLDPESVLKKDSYWINDLQSIEIAAKRKANEVMTKIKWPDFFKLLDQLTIKTFYSDITIDDLYNKDLLNEFKEKGLISEAHADQLASFKKGIEVSTTTIKETQAKLFP